MRNIITIVRNHMRIKEAISSLFRGLVTTGASGAGCSGAMSSTDRVETPSPLSPFGVDASILSFASKTRMFPLIPDAEVYLALR